MSGRNSDLPILDELGAEFASLVEAAERRSADPGASRAFARPDAGPRIVPSRPGTGARRRIAPSPSATGRERRSQARRIGRRAALVAALVCLVGGVAFAALRGGSDDRADTAPASLGSAGDGAWTFSVHRDGGRLCGVFVPRGGEPSARCGIAPGAGRAWAQSAVAEGRRLVFGLAGPSIASVEATATGPDAGAEARTDAGAGAGRQAKGPTRSPVDTAAAADAGLPEGDRWFVLDLGPAAPPGRAQAPVAVTPLDRRGRRAGPSYLDCSLGIVGEGCRRRIEATAR